MKIVSLIIGVLGFFYFNHFVFAQNKDAQGNIFYIAKPSVIASDAKTPVYDLYQEKIVTDENGLNFKVLEIAKRDSVDQIAQRELDSQAEIQAINLYETNNPAPASVNAVVTP